MFKKDSLLLYSFGGLAFLITGVIFWNYFTPEWKSYQQEFQELVTEKFGAEKADAIPEGLQQIWV
ncbi:MAG TPA: hypothetical protein VIB00_01730, partial [Pyrinomonadaceae bacterium]